MEISIMSEKQTKATNEALIRRLYDALTSQDFQAYMNLLSDDIVYYAAGDCPVSGVHRGKEALMRIGQITFQETNGTHRVKLKRMVANESYVAVIDTWTAERKAKQIQMDNLLVYKIVAGKVTEIREFLGNEAKHDDFWK
jgi:ketosteroid isomerase-like protein